MPNRTFAGVCGGHFEPFLTSSLACVIGIEESTTGGLLAAKSAADVIHL